MNKFRILLSLIVAVSSGLFAWRHHSLRQLKTEQAQLEQQLAEATNQPAAIEPAPVGSTNIGLSAAERSELLRLRGQVGSLRQELAQATNDLVNLAHPMPTASSAATDEPIVSKVDAVKKMSAGRQWALALIMYAQSHQQRLPATLAEALPFANQDRIEGAEFEFVRTNLDLLRIKSPSTTIVLRETKSWKTYNGRWNRTYAFADGHIENAVVDTNDFTEWEARHQPQDPLTGQ